MKNKRIGFHRDDDPMEELMDDLAKAESEKQKQQEEEIGAFLQERFPPAAYADYRTVFRSTDDLKRAIADQFGYEMHKLPIDSWGEMMKNLDYKQEMGYWLIKSGDD